MLTTIVSRGPIRSVSAPPTMPPSTAPMVKTASAVPACTAEKPRVVRKSTRKTCRKAPNRLTKMPASRALAATGASRQVARIPAPPSLPARRRLGQVGRLVRPAPRVLGTVPRAPARRPPPVDPAPPPAAGVGVAVTGGTRRGSGVRSEPSCPWQTRHRLRSPSCPSAPRPARPGRVSARLGRQVVRDHGCGDCAADGGPAGGDRGCRPGDAGADSDAERQRRRREGRSACRWTGRCRRRRPRPCWS